MIHALEKEGLAGVNLKWPNDLIHRHLKLGGILVELNGDALGPSTVVVGVGLNVRLPRELRRDLAQPVTDLTSVAGRGAPPIDRNRLLARLVDELAATLGQYAKEGFAPYYIFQEFGTVFHAAQPSLTPAWYELRPSFIEDARDIANTITGG